jgi:hypothetical protein
MKSEGTCAYRNDSVLVTGWKDKSDDHEVYLSSHINGKSGDRSQKGATERNSKATVFT